MPYAEEVAVKKSRDYVTNGTPAPEPPEREEPVFPEPAQPRRFSSGMNPADLPRDYGMAGPVGAYEVKRLARFIPASLRGLTKQFSVDNPLDSVNTALDRLLPAAERHRLVAESFVGRTLTLSITRRSDRFSYGRFLVPKLRKALEPELGRLNILLTDR